MDAVWRWWRGGLPVVRRGARFSQDEERVICEDVEVDEVEKDEERVDEERVCGAEWEKSSGHGGDVGQNDHCKDQKDGDETGQADGAARGETQAGIPADQEGGTGRQRRLERGHRVGDERRVSRSRMVMVLLLMRLRSGELSREQANWVGSSRFAKLGVEVFTQAYIQYPQYIRFRSTVPVVVHWAMTRRRT